MCVTLTEKTAEDMIKKAEKAKAMGADIVELRLDYLAKLDEGVIKKLIESIKIPKIATLRPEREKGLYSGEEAVRLGLLLKAISFGAEYVDLELSSDVGWRYEVSKASGKKGTKLIVSYHNFEETPCKEKLTEILKTEFAAGADIAKIATMPKTVDDVFKVISAVNEFKRDGREVIGISMDKLGIMSRVFAKEAGSSLTYASIEQGKESAAGQITIDKLKKIRELLEA